MATSYIEKYSNIQVHHPGELEWEQQGYYTNSVAAKGQFPLLIIREAWHSGVSFEDLADGFGPGLGTNGGDWSGIRDSSDSAINKMLERAINCMRFKP